MSQGIVPPASISTPSLSSDQTWTGTQTFSRTSYGNWSAKGAPWFDATHTSFAGGAKGDGTTDDTAAIQAALAAALAAGGGTVFLPAGTYKISSSLQLMAHMSLVGAGVNATIIATTAATFDAVRMGNRQVDGVMRNWMILRDLTVNHPGGASSFACVHIDGGGVGTCIERVLTQQGKYGFQLTDLDRCIFSDIFATNQRTAGIYCEVGLENTWGTVTFLNPSVAVSDTNGIGWLFDHTVAQSSPNPFQRITITGCLFYSSVGVSGSVGLKMNVGANAFCIQGSLFENPIFHIVLTGATNLELLACSFLQNSGVSTDIVQFNTNTHQVNCYDCNFQQATNVFHQLSGGASVGLFGMSINNGNLTNLWVGSFTKKWGTDTVFAGDKNLALALNNQQYDYAFINRLCVGQSGSAPAVGNGGTIATDVGDSRVAPTGNVTGVILSGGGTTGQFLTVINESAFTITMAASGTSNVAAGVLDVIGANRCAMYKWDGTTSLWYRASSDRRYSTQSVAYAATITPDATAGDQISVGTLTGNITVAAPTSPATGQGLTFVFTQDGTGGRTVTWNAVFRVNWIPSTVPNARNTMTVQYDGTSWNQVSEAVGL